MRHWLTAKEPQCEDNNCAIYHEHMRSYHEARKAYQVETEEEFTKKILVDMQKVQLLPRLPTIKWSLFTRRLVTINHSFVPIYRSSKGGICVLWNKGLVGQNEDVKSAFFTVLNLPPFWDTLHWLFWLDNCDSRNKYWTLFSYLALAVSSDDGPDRITLKYFVSRHTFMFVDVFLREIEEGDESNSASLRFQWFYGMYEKNWWSSSYGV